MRRLTPREISIIEEHTGFTLKRWDNDDCPMGRLSEALAFVALKRENPTRPVKEIWDEAGDTVIEMETDDPDPTQASDSTQS